MAKVTAPKGNVNKMIDLISICYSNLNCLRALHYFFFGALRMTHNYVVKTFLIFFSNTVYWQFICLYS